MKSIKLTDLVRATQGDEAALKQLYNDLFRFPPLINFDDGCAFFSRKFNRSLAALTYACVAKYILEYNFIACVANLDDNLALFQVEKSSDSSKIDVRDFVWMIAAANFSADGNANHMSRAFYGALALKNVFKAVSNNIRVYTIIDLDHTIAVLELENQEEWVWDPGLNPEMLHSKQSYLQDVLPSHKYYKNDLIVTFPVNGQGVYHLTAEVCAHYKLKRKQLLDFVVENLKVLTVEQLMKDKRYVQGLENFGTDINAAVVSTALVLNGWKNKYSQKKMACSFNNFAVENFTEDYDEILKAIFSENFLDYIEAVFARVDYVLTEKEKNNLQIVFTNILMAFTEHANETVNLSNRGNYAKRLSEAAVAYKYLKKRTPFAVSAHALFSLMQALREIEERVVGEERLLRFGIFKIVGDGRCVFMLSGSNSDWKIYDPIYAERVFDMEYYLSFVLPMHAARSSQPIEETLGSSLPLTLLQDFQNQCLGIEKEARARCAVKIETQETGEVFDATPEVVVDKPPSDFWPLIAYLGKFGNTEIEAVQTMVAKLKEYAVDSIVLPKSAHVHTLFASGLWLDEDKKFTCSLMRHLLQEMSITNNGHESFFGYLNPEDCGTKAPQRLLMSQFYQNVIAGNLLKIGDPDCRAAYAAILMLRRIKNPGLKVYVKQIENTNYFVVKVNDPKLGSMIFDPTLNPDLIFAESYYISNIQPHVLPIVRGKPRADLEVTMRMRSAYDNNIFDIQLEVMRILDKRREMEAFMQSAALQARLAETSTPRSDWQDKVEHTLNELHLNVVPQFEEYFAVPTDKRDSVQFASLLENFKKNIVRGMSRYDLERALATCDFALRMTQNSDFIYLRASILYMLEDYNNALLDLRKLLRMRPSWQAYLHTSMVNRQLRQYADALEAVEKGMALDNSNAQLYFERALIGWDQDKTNDAQSDIEESLKIQPSECAFRQRALLKYKNKDFAGANADCKRALELDPQSAPAYFLQGNLELDQGNVKTALVNYNIAIKLEGTNLEFYFARAACHFIKQDFAMVVEDCNFLLAQKKNFSALYYLRAAALIKLGKFAETIVFLTNYILANPTDVHAITLQAQVKLLSGSTGAAIVDYAKAQRLCATCDASKIKSAITKIEIGNIKGAVLDFKQAFKGLVLGNDHTISLYEISQRVIVFDNANLIAGNASGLFARKFEDTKNGFGKMKCEL